MEQKWNSLKFWGWDNFQFSRLHCQRTGWDLQIIIWQKKFNCCYPYSVVFSYLMSSSSLKSFGSYLIVGILWGCTNPFIKRGQAAVENSSNNHSNKAWKIMRFLELRILVPFLINQCGSLLFYYLLSTEPLGIATPIVNCLTFVFTAITAILIKEETIESPLSMIIGIGLVILGLCICLNS